MNAEARLGKLKNQGKTSDNENANLLVSSGVGGEWMNVATKQECRQGSCSGSAVGKSAGEETDKPGDRSDTESCTVQHAAVDSSDVEGCKRRAAEMEGAANTASLHARAHPVRKTMLEANSATSGSTPKMRRASEGKRKQQQTPWSPLDKLCNLASTFQK